MSSRFSNRRDVAAQATRVAILASARVAFGKRGFAAASLAEIARDAQATTGALYHHFPDKRSLFAAVAEDIERELLESLAKSASDTRDLWDLVLHTISETLEITARPGIANVIFREAPTVLGLATWRKIEMRYGFGQLHTLLRALSTAGRLGTFDPAIVAGIILGSLVQTVESILNSSDKPLTLRDARAAMTAMALAFRTDPQ